MAAVAAALWGLNGVQISMLIAIGPGAGRAVAMSLRRFSARLAIDETLMRNLLRVRTNQRSRKPSGGKIARTIE